MRNKTTTAGILLGVLFFFITFLFLSFIGCSDDDDDDHPPTYTPTPTATVTPTATPAYFIKTFSGAGFDVASAVVAIDADRYIIAGTTDSLGAGNYDFYLISIDAAGNELWSTTAGGQGDDWCDDLLVTEDDQILAVGYTDSWGAGEHDILLIAFDFNGNQLWQRTYGGPYQDFGTGITSTADGNFALSGFTDIWGQGYSDMLIIKVDSSGNQLWSNTFGSSLGDFAMDIINTSDGGFLLGGNSFSFSGIANRNDCYFVKTDASGNQIWGLVAGGSDKDESFSLLQMSDGKFLFSGFSYQIHYTNDAFMGAIDTSGTLVWTNYYGGPRYETAFSTIQLGSGDLVTAGYTDSSGYGYGDVSLRRLNQSGSEIWSRTIGYEGEEVAYDLIETADHGFLIVGTTDSVGEGSFDLLVIKTDENGNY